MALLFRVKEKKYIIEEEKTRGKNVISFHMELGEARYHVVGCYIPLSDKTGEMLGDIVHALECQPKGTQTTIMGGLNA